MVKRVPPGARVSVAWTWEPGKTANNPVRLRDDGGALVFRAGTLAQPIRPCVPGWPARSLATIQADPQDEPARRLAIRLLDSGSADQVLITGDPKRDLPEFTGNDPWLNANTRLLVISPREPHAPRAGWGGGAISSATSPVGAYALVTADYEQLAGWLDFPGTEALERAPVQVLRSSGPMPWHGGPEQSPDDATGITWVRICPGTFTLGSDPATDTMSRKDERPTHPVVLGAFDIALTETTNGQYRRYRSEHEQEKSEDLPAVNLDWQAARDFCRWAGGDLPTEAQWEYAARGGSITPWSFGWDETRLGAFAWYSGNSGSKLQPAAKKSPNPLGLRDMHGNAWEWVRDWVGTYGGEMQMEPQGAESGEYRVLRGGSFEGSPERLRSAGRDDVLPEFRVPVNGVRCVRVPSPQH